jgi:hypothetical protein
MISESALPDQKENVFGNNHAWESRDKPQEYCQRNLESNNHTYNAVYREMTESRGQLSRRVKNKTPSSFEWRNFNRRI